MTRVRLVFVALLCLASSSVWADLRTYDVDPQYSQEIFGALRELLEVAGQPGVRYGRVELLPTGQILVNATPETLDEVEQLLRAIRARPPGSTPRVELRYWVVQGRGAPVARTGQDAETVSPNFGPPPAALNGVLDEIKRVHGDLAFQILATAAVVSESGQLGGVEGMPLTVYQRAHVQGDTLNAELKVQLSGVVPWDNSPRQVGQLDVRTSLERGEFVVLGEGTHRIPWPPTYQGGRSDGTLFYIVHWPE
jgi:hypothetical protein